MIKKIAIALLVSLGIMKAQTVVTLDDVKAQYAIGLTYTEYVDTTERTVDIGYKASGNYWDFSNLGLQAKIAYHQKIVSPSTTPYFRTFPNSDFAIYVTESSGGAKGEIWWYGGFTSDEAISYGYGSTAQSQFGSVKATLECKPGEVQGVFPLKRGTEWLYNGKEYFSMQTGILPLESEADVSISYHVDAEGTLKLPNGKEVEALRLYEVRHREITIQPGLTETVDEVVYTFFSKTGEEVSVTLTDVNQPTEGSVKVDGILWNNGKGTSTVEITNETLPQDFNLQQNYPNPFGYDGNSDSPTTNIVYSLSKPAKVHLSVYDMLGREVATIVNEYQSAGTYHEVFNALDLPSGNYLLRLSVGNFSQVRKMMLVK